MTRVYTPSLETLHKIHDDHFKLLRLIEDLQRRVQAVDGADDSGLVFFKNGSGETVPAFGAMRVTAYSATNRTATVAKPSSASQDRYLVNGDQPVSDGGTGWAHRLDAIAEVLYDVSDGTPAYGETWGPESGSWLIHKGKRGFRIWGGNTDSPVKTFAIQVGIAQPSRVGANGNTPSLTAGSFISFNTSLLNNSGFTLINGSGTDDFLEHAAGGNFAFTCHFMSSMGASVGPYQLSIYTKTAAGSPVAGNYNATWTNGVASANNDFISFSGFFTLQPGGAVGLGNAGGITISITNLQFTAHQID